MGPVRGRFSHNWGPPRARGRGGPAGGWGLNNFRGGFNNRRGGGNYFRGGGPVNQWRGNRGNAASFRGRPRPETPGKRLTEKDIGVTEYISENTGFNGIIKFRYSDFQVSEINLKGEVARLTTLEPPPRPAEHTEVEDDDGLLSRFDLEVLPIETWDNINALVTPVEPTDEKVEIDVTGMTKEERTRIHDAVKKVFQESIVGSTVAVGDKKFVTFQRFRKGVRIDNRKKWIWPLEYVYFIVHKENCDTMDAAGRIASRLGILGSGSKVNNLSYAGTKDRRAKTSQWFSIRKYDPKMIALACENMDNILVGNYSFAPEPLKLGMLKGNRFRIVLRNVTAPDDIVERSCVSLRERGFINYYGLQRFGTNVDVPTYDTGRKLMKGDFRGALDNILASVSGRPGRDSVEARVQRQLQHSPRDLLAALTKVPRNTRLLYLHSYQSFVWNRCVSERLRRHGWSPVVGDLVPVDDLDDEEEIESDNESDGEKEADKTQDGADKPQPPPTEAEVKPKAKFQQVRALTQEDLDNKTFTIFDVVLPLPGFDVQYPTNMKDYYEELLTKDGLTLDLRNKIKAYSMSGAYRRVVCSVSDMSWRVVRYSDARRDLQRSDADLLRGESPCVYDADGQYKALLLELSLPSSSYATMALRELMKVDTNSDYQASQNKYHLQGNKKDEAKDKQSDDTESEVVDQHSEVVDQDSEVNDKESEVSVSESANSEKRKLDVSDDVEIKKIKTNE